jgi:UDP-N-acetylmuramoyl-L-alanyl-D-glutamate--2,6-diaminopimelate ligase
LHLIELLRTTAAAVATAPPLDPEIAGLAADSREVRQGYLFAALPGTRLDGRAFAADAVSRGAVAILTDRAEALALSAADREQVAVIIDANPQRCLARLAGRFCGRPPRTIAAVTGTNGKTSTVEFLRQIWTALGQPAASLGTLGLVTSGKRRPGMLTTPDSVALHRDLAALVREGVEHAAIEASSHGLAQYRLDGLSIAAAAFTNLTRDHLDYHGDMARYRAAKERLFGELLVPDGAAVLNADSAEFPRLAALCRERALPILAYGTDRTADLRLVERRPYAGGQAVVLEIFGPRHELALPLAGEFQAMNALAALGLALATGAAEAPALAALPRLSGPPGRLQFVAEHSAGGAVVVDYAHTPDALATVLAALRPHTGGRLVVLFGCGGDRDPGKRALMGRVATESADRVYVTDDNPRNEEPAAIRRAILAAAPDACEIGDRRRAIEAAIAGLGPGDLLVIAGKGHETGQIVAGRILPFDDAALVREILGHRAAWQVSR